MVNCVDYYGSGVYQSKTNSQVFELNNNEVNENNIVSFGVSKPKEKLEELVDKDKEFLSTCTDGVDDGKISFKEGTKAFLGGIANHYLGFVEEVKDYVKENPVKSAALAIGALAVGGIALATLGAPVVLGLISVACIVFGVKSICSAIKGAINNIKNAKNAQTDAEKKQSLYGLGGNSGEFIDGVTAIYGGAKGLKGAATAIAQADDYGRMIADTSDDVAENMKDLLKKAENGSLSEEELDILKEFLDKKENLPKSLKEYQENTLMGKLMSWSAKKGEAWKLKISA